MALYLNFYGFDRDPFGVTPDPDFLFMTPGHKEALAQLLYAIQERKGFILVSAEVGMAKPRPEIFQLAASRLGVPPEACVFVDDWDQNVDAARAVGMQAVLHRVDKGDDLRGQLTAVGVAVGA